MTLGAIAGFAPFFIACTLAALTGVLFPAPKWYRQLTRPNWAPPTWLFGPVWTVLYVMIAVAGWRLSLGLPAAAAVAALTAWTVQIALNAGWTPLFFGLKRPDLGFYVIATLWVAIVATIVLAWPVDTLAAWLMLPYLAWVSFASALNFSVWRLNGATRQRRIPILHVEILPTASPDSAPCQATRACSEASGAF